MFSARLLILVLSLVFAGCGDMMDDLRPSDVDNSGPVETGTGPNVGQNAPDFTVSDSLGNSLNLSSELATADAVVLYFTMWCPICDSHMSHMLRNAVLDFPNVKFFAVDYVSGSVANSRSAEISNGYANTPFTVLADVDNHILNSYGATMGTTVIIESAGVIRMNEDYKDGSKLENILRSLQ